MGNEGAAHERRSSSDAENASDSFSPPEAAGQWLVSIEDDGAELAARDQVAGATVLILGAPRKRIKNLEGRLHQILEQAQQTAGEEEDRGENPGMLQQTLALLLAWLNDIDGVRSKARMSALVLFESSSEVAFGYIGAEEPALTLDGETIEVPWIELRHRNGREARGFSLEARPGMELNLAWWSHAESQKSGQSLVTGGWKSTEEVGEAIPEDSASENAVLRLVESPGDDGFEGEALLDGGAANPEAPPAAGTAHHLRLVDSDEALKDEIEKAISIEPEFGQPIGDIVVLEDPDLATDDPNSVAAVTQGAKFFRWLDRIVARKAEGADTAVGDEELESESFEAGPAHAALEPVASPEQEMFEGASLEATEYVAMIEASEFENAEYEAAALEAAEYEAAALGTAEFGATALEAAELETATPESAELEDATFGYAEFDEPPAVEPERLVAAAPMVVPSAETFEPGFTFERVDPDEWSESEPPDSEWGSGPQAGSATPQRPGVHPGIRRVLETRRLRRRATDPGYRPEASRAAPPAAPPRPQGQGSIVPEPNARTLEPGLASPPDLRPASVPEPRAAVPESNLVAAAESNLAAAPESSLASAPEAQTVAPESRAAAIPDFQPRAPRRSRPVVPVVSRAVAPPPLPAVASPESSFVEPAEILHESPEIAVVPQQSDAEIPVASESSLDPISQPREARRPAWPEAHELDRAERDRSRPRLTKPLIIAAGVAVLFVGGWLLGRVPSSSKPAATGSPIGRALRAVGLGAPSFACEVTSEPAGATVMIDGKPTGRVTPVNLDLSPGDHVVALGLPGLGSVNLPIRGARGKHTTLHADLNGSLDVRTSNALRRVDVEVDGEPRGSAPVTISKLAPGPHEVRFHEAGVASWSQAVDLKVQESAEILARPFEAPSTGLLEVTATLADDDGSQPVTGAVIYVDGRRRGSTPLTLELADGPHSVRVAYRDEQSPVQVINLPGGNQRFASFQLGLNSDAPRLTMTSPSGTMSRDKPAVVSVTLDGVRPSEVREMWLHVRTPDGLWKRYAMEQLGSSGAVVGVAVFPMTMLDKRGRAPYYASASTTLGDEYFIELQNADGSGTSASQP